MHTFETPVGFEPTYHDFADRDLNHSDTVSYFVGITGLEPVTSDVSDRRSKPTELYSNLVPRSGFEPLPSACKTDTLPLRHRGISSSYEIRTHIFALEEQRPVQLDEGTKFAE